jgi:polar amino acid transport system permease protein
MEIFAEMDFSAIWKYREALLWGLLTTLWMAFAAFFMAVPGGLLLAFGRLKGGWIVNIPIMAFVDLMRFTPLLVQAVWIHFALPIFTGASMTATQSGLLALTLHVSAYICDIIRSGITAVPRGQWEAAKALGLKPYVSFFRVILPQVWPLVLPALANVAVSTFKLTAILGILAVDDLMKVANRINNMVFRPIEVYTSVALIYLACGLILTVLAAWFERRYGSDRLDRIAVERPAPAVIVRNELSGG